MLACSQNNGSISKNLPRKGCRHRRGRTTHPGGILMSGRQLVGDSLAQVRGHARIQHGALVRRWRCPPPSLGTGEDESFAPAFVGRQGERANTRQRSHPLAPDSWPLAGERACPKRRRPPEGTHCPRDHGERATQTCWPCRCVCFGRGHKTRSARPRIMSVRGARDETKCRFGTES